ncbi:polysaccharide deacetylase family sporulation protein PdaB [Carboxydothermus ferrireducens]|uniref:Polysaccharide deacetylase family sporulation protein PdaB n=1 Tax=Carboxydothermus ferrireducens DSM 11255 TaxID=1119529 RepID=A0ABX2RB07_9THEO|nr:polysaccharide deacetylase family sporulation protein PdaB [Carboxydothermus ferrireducens]NYE58356.1 polysaccharide deacetylase family sporulation protein PdaB [Carboxydothermus ferrireducens DSM 11255]
MKVFFFNYKNLWQYTLILIFAILIGLVFYHYLTEPVIKPQIIDFYPVYKVETSKKVVALTFDLSWGTKTYKPILNTLRKENIKATFFLSGPWAKQHPEIVREIVKDGHEIGSHGHRHVNYTGLSPEEIKKEVFLAHEAIKEASNKTPTIIRLPNGDYNKTVIKTLREIGYTAIQWSVDSLDWKNPGEEIILKRVLDSIHPGAIILMHASDTCKQTGQVLPEIIKELKKQGYTFITISRLLTLGPAAIQ